jgi:hypothetical protein
MSKMVDDLGPYVFGGFLLLAFFGSRWIEGRRK